MGSVGNTFNESDRRELRFPRRLDDPGLLVAWSLDYDDVPSPMGFSTGNPQYRPETGWIDPILMVREGHLLTIAPTGAGKGRGCIIPALLRHEGPVIVIDPKGENVAVTARRRREMGQQVVVLDPMGITGAPVGSFNPLDLIDAESVEAVDLATTFATAMVDGKEDPEDAYWYQRAQFLLSSIMLHVATETDPARRSFARVREILSDVVGERRGDGEPALSGTSLELARSPHPEARRVRSLLQSGAREGLSSILSMAQNGVDFLRGPLVEAATAKTDFSLDAVTRGDPLSIYIVLPPHMLESHGRLLRLWVMALLSLITRRRGRPDRSTLFILDEAAQLGPLPQLRQAITLLRGYGVQTWSFWQDASQLRLLYPQDWQTMVNNCAVIQCFGALNQSAAEAMAELTGFGNGRMVLDLNSYQMLLQMAGKRAVVARRPDYLNDPPFAGQFEPNPFHNRAQDIVPPPAPRIALLPKPMIVQPDEHGLSAFLDRQQKKRRTDSTRKGGSMADESGTDADDRNVTDVVAADSGNLVEFLAIQIRAVADRYGHDAKQLARRVGQFLDQRSAPGWIKRRPSERNFPWYWNWPQLEGLKPADPGSGTDVWMNSLPVLQHDDRIRMAQLLSPAGELPPGAELRSAELVFYPGCHLVHVWDMDLGDMFGIVGPEDPTVEGPPVLLCRLNGTSPPIHELNGSGRLNIEKISAQLDYLRFFCIMVHGENGPFRIVEPGGKDVRHFEEMRDPNPAPRPEQEWNAERRTGLEQLPRLRVSKIGLDGRPQIDARVFYGWAFFNAKFAVDLSGMTEMLDDEPLGTGGSGKNEG